MLLLDSYGQKKTDAVTNCQPLTDCSFPQATGWTYTESPRVFDLPDSRRTGHGPCHCLDLNRGREEAFRGDNGVDNDVHTHRQTKRKSDIKKKTNMNMRCKSSQCQWHVKENDGILHCCGPWWRRIQMLKRCLFRSSSVAHFLCPNIMSISRYFVMPPNTIREPRESFTSCGWSAVSTELSLGFIKYIQYYFSG